MVPCSKGSGAYGSAGVCSSGGEGGGGVCGVYAGKGAVGGFIVSDVIAPSKSSNLLSEKNSMSASWLAGWLAIEFRVADECAVCT